MQYPSINDADLKGKRVLLRAGFDVPMENGVVLDSTRIVSIVPTMRFILDAGASLILMAHQGRPKGGPDPSFSLKPLVSVLEKLLETKVSFAEQCIGPETQKLAKALEAGAVLLLENLRFDEREKKNDPAFARELAALAEIYVNDAFTNSHRAHASMVGVPKLLPSFMGLQLEREVTHLKQALEDPRRPLALVISGAKMETKIPVIEKFLQIGDDILVGGCIANTFIAARGFDVGTSKYERDFVEKAQEIMLLSEREDMAKIHIPRDAVVASTPKEDAVKIDLPLEDIAGDMGIFDIGKVTVDRYIQILEQAGTIIWNGPLGLYELNRFSHATKRVAEVIGRMTGEKGVMSIIGGGDTLDFHERYGYPLDVYTFVSTGGGAMLDFLAGVPLPALEALKQSST